MNKSDLIFRFLCGIFFAIAILCIGRYLHYESTIVAFPYDWEATDGDHLNFAHRIAQGLPIYLSMGAGQVLSIYNPLYHGLVALVGGVDASMSLARGIALLFWILCPIAIFLFYKKQWGYLYSTLAAVFILLPSEPYMLMDIVQVSPNSTMAFLFLCTLLTAEFCTKYAHDSWLSWLTLGVLAAFCFLAKQQGIVAIGCVLPFLIIKRVRFGQLALVTVAFTSVFAISYFYLESINSGQYLRATIFDLKQIMSYDPVLAKTRLYSFTFLHNAAFTFCVVASLLTVAVRLDKLSVWHVSFIVHLFFLLKILGNGGGGPNYFLTFWITTVLISVGLIAKFMRRNADLTSPFFQITEKVHGRLSMLASTMLLSLFVSIAVGTFSIHQQLSTSIIPSVELKEIMRSYYQSIDELVASKPEAKVLTNRNVGAWAATKVKIENEGSTMFQYAWIHGDIFQPDVVLTAIKNKKYDFIATGIQNYPANVEDEIRSNYKIAMVKEEILNMGNVGLSTIYIPK